MRHDSCITGTVCNADCVERFRERADLVDLHQQRIRKTLIDPFAKALGVRDEQIVADQLHGVADPVGQGLPALEIVFRHTVFYRTDRIIPAQLVEIFGHLMTVERQALAGNFVLAVLEEFGRRAVERQCDILTWFEPGLLDRRHDEVECIARAGQIGGETTFVADGCGQALFMQLLLQGVEHLGAPAHGFGQAVRTDRHYHEFLDIDRVVRVLAAIDDVHHRHGKNMRRYAADIAIERKTAGVRCSLRHGHARAEDRVRPDAALVRRSIEGDHGQIDVALVFGIECTDQQIPEFGIHGADGLGHALAEIAILVPVTQFDRFVGAGGRSAGNGGAAETAVVQQHIDFDGWIAPRIENFAGMDVDNRGHGSKRSGQRCCNGL